MSKWGIPIFLMLLASSLFSQVWSETTASQDSLSQLPSSPEIYKSEETDELVLDEIEIKGKVEKPGVIILPKRVEPEMGEVELGRSFKREVKDGIGDLPKAEDVLGKVERVNSIKKTVERNRK